MRLLNFMYLLKNVFVEFLYKIKLYKENGFNFMKIIDFGPDIISHEIN